MPTEAARKSGDLIQFTEKDIDLIRRTKMPEGSSEDDLQLLLYYARKTGLNPLLNQVYPSKRKGKVTPQATIDGFRIAAERTGEYLGQTTPLFCGPDGQWTDAWVSDAPPVLAKVGILRRGFKEPLYGLARYAAYRQTDRQGQLMDTWAKMADTMLAKTAEALAFRKAFPNLLSGLYTAEEMDHLENEEQGPTPVQPQTPQQNTPKPGPTPASRQAPKAAKPGEGGITEEQVKQMWELAQGIGLGVTELTKKCGEVLDTDIATPRALTSEQADIVIAELLKTAQAKAEETPPPEAHPEAPNEAPSEVPPETVPAEQAAAS